MQENKKQWALGACIVQKLSESSAALISYLVDPQGCQIVARVVGGDLGVAHLGHPQALLGIVSAADSAATLHTQHCGQKGARDELHV
jgi:hypothetical protein